VPPEGFKTRTAPQPVPNRAGATQTLNSIGKQQASQASGRDGSDSASVVVTT